MSSVVLDASALLAFLRREPASERVEAILHEAVISSVGLSEAVAMALDYGGVLDQVFATLSCLPVQTIPFGVSDAYLAASLRPPTRHLGLSLGDRCCLSLGTKLGLAVVTTDETWAGFPMPTGIEIIR
jgi:PIN domain nuclease of toxin-antitoxin system